MVYLGGNQVRVSAMWGALAFTNFTNRDSGVSIRKNNHPLLRTPPRAQLRVVIFCQIDTLLSRLVKLAKACAPHIALKRTWFPPTYTMFVLTAGFGFKGVQFSGAHLGIFRDSAELGG